MEIAIQQPLQMPFTLLSTLEPGESSARIASSPGIAGPLVTVPSMRPPVAPPGGLPAVPAEPTGPPPAPDADPEEFAVPAELVPSALAPFAPLEPTHQPQIPRRRQMMRLRLTHLLQILRSLHLPPPCARAEMGENKAAMRSTLQTAE